MLASWYFCCCIKASPSSTSAFLSILETLENEHSDDQLLYLAYTELQQADSWMQIYALPFVLKSLRNPYLPDSQHADVLEPYLEGLIEGLEGLSPLAARRYKYSSLAIRHLFEGISTSELIVALEETAKRYLYRKNELENSQIPYLDLREFLPETVMLGIAAELCEQDEGFAQELAIKLTGRGDDAIGDDYAIGRLVEDALDHQCGRLAFLMSVTLVRLTKTQSQAEVKNTFWQAVLDQDASTFELEPDLMGCYATVLFRWQTAQSPEATVDKIIEESRTMSQLAQVPANPAAPAEPIYRLGFDDAPDLRLTLPSIYWKCTLWHLAVKTDSNAAALRISEFWQVPDRIPGRTVIKGPLFSSERWRSKYEGLASLRTWNTKLGYSESTKVYLENANQWVFDSPWIERIYRHNEKDSQRYKTITKPGNLIRLIAGIGVAYEILQSIHSNSPVYATYCSLIAHAADVINKVYGKWLTEFEQGDSERSTDLPTLNIPFTGLALFAYRQTTTLGAGRLTSVSPDSFVRILQTYDAHLASGSFEDENPQSKDFFEEVLPEVSIFWIADAYPSALKNSPSKRWLPWIPYVNRCYRKGEKHGFPSKQLAALIWRFIGNEDVVDIDYESLDWRNQKALHHRALLISRPDLPLEEWDINWDEKENKVDKSRVLSCRIARTLQRLQALGRRYSNPEDVPKHKERWLEEWKDYLNAVSQGRGLDRFTRLLLLEVIENRLLQDSEDLKIIAYMLLEYGCSYDLQHLIEYIYATDSDGRLLRPTSAKRDLQRVFAQSMFDFVEENAAALSEPDDQRRIQAPREAKISLQKAELFSSTLSRIAYAAYQSDGRLLRQFNQILESTIQTKCRTGSLRSQRLDVEPRKVSKEIIKSDRFPAVNEWTIRAAVFNVNRFDTTLFYDDLEVETDCNNLFTLSKPEVKELIAKENTSLKVLATIVEVSPLSASEVKDLCYTFNCGLASYLEYFSNDIFIDANTQFYPYVVLELKRKSPTDDWWVDNAITLKPKLRPGDIKQIAYAVRGANELMLNGRKRPLALALTEEGRKTNRCERYEPAVWESNTSALFRKKERNSAEDGKSEKGISIFGELDSQEHWKPYNQELFGLLLAIALQKMPSQTAVLTFIGEKSSVFGSQQWHFSTQIGTNFILEKRQFTQSAEDEIEAKIEKVTKQRGAARGLLIVVEPTVENSQVCLQLRESSDGLEALEEDFPSLRLPFDDRNLRWEHLFGSLESGDLEEPTFVAQREPESRREAWFCETNKYVPGFPDRVSVVFSNPPNAAAQKVDFVVKRWHPNWGTLEGQQLESYEIKIKDGDWDSFLDDWLSLKKYSPLRLRRGQSSNNSNISGYITCMTAENIMVLAELESLSMRPMDSDNRISLSTVRDAEVIEVKEKDKLPIELDVDALQLNLSQSSSYSGVLTRVPRFGEGETYGVVWKTQGEAVLEDVVIRNIPKSAFVSQVSVFEG